MNITFTEAIKLFYRRYTDFDGRSTRAEYWYVALYTFVASLILGLISRWFEGAFSLINLVPSIALSIRRMHDINKSGWWVLLNLVPIIGWIWFIVLAATPSKEPGYQG